MLTNSNKKEPQSQPQLKSGGAVWCRISTPQQESLEGQRARTIALLNREGYNADHTFIRDWGSLDLFSCPEFQELRYLISQGKIKALAVLDRDRLEAKGRQRLVFLAELKEASVKLLLCQGLPILDEPEGELVELALAIGKERSVLRARQGAKDGMADKVNLKRRPIRVSRGIWGHDWHETGLRLVPNKDWNDKVTLFNLLREDLTFPKVCAELERRGILTPSGKTGWTTGMVHSIAHHPVNAGRYYGLRSQAIEPKERRGGKRPYGKTSVQIKDLQDATYLSEVDVIDPPITWAEREELLPRLKQRQKFSSRNSKYDYILRGRILCAAHLDRFGEPRRFYGQSDRSRHVYRCPVKDCDRRSTCPVKSIPAWLFHLDAKINLHKLLMMQPEEVFEDMRERAGKGHSGNLRKQLHTDLSHIQHKIEKNLAAQTKLEDRFNRDEVEAEVYNNLIDTYRKERAWLKEQESERLDELSQLGREEEAAVSLQQIKSQLSSELKDLDFDELKDLLSRLNFRFVINPGSSEPMVVKYNLPLPQNDAIASQRVGYCC